MSFLFKGFVPRMSKHYAFMFSPEVPKDWLERIPGEAEERWNQVLKIVQISEEKINWTSRYAYVVKMAQTDDNGDGQNKGHVYPSMIECFATRESDLKLPFLHEEAHAIVYRQWGRLPSFWSEGVAEYISSFLMNPDWKKPHQDEYEAVIKLALKYIDSGIDELICDLDDKEFWRLKNLDMVDYRVASIFVYYIVKIKGWDYLHKILNDLCTNSNSFLRNEVNNQKLVTKWKSFLIKEQVKLKFIPL